MEPVSDLRDTRVLIPRLRRAIDGPEATSSASVAATLSDEQLNAIGADAIASVIYYSGSLFGCKLEVAERDPMYMAPTAWRTDPALTEEKIVAVVSQAALDYFYMRLSTGDSAKTSEVIADEATRWEWSISATAVAERLKQLRADRDAALQMLAEEGEVTDTSWTSFIAVRDGLTSRLIEPWIAGAGGSGGLSSLEFV